MIAQRARIGLVLLFPLCVGVGRATAEETPAMSLQAQVEALSAHVQRLQERLDRLERSLPEPDAPAVAARLAAGPPVGVAPLCAGSAFPAVAPADAVDQVSAVTGGTTRAEPTAERGAAMPAAQDLAAQDPENGDSLERFVFDADFRYRFDGISDDGRLQDGRRDRARIRARPALVGNLTEAMRIGFGLISGDDDPLSGNQTLGEGASSKDWRLDQAYVSWDVHPTATWTAGKHRLHMFRPAGHFLILDGDLRPEGMAFGYDNGRLFSNAGFSHIESDDRGGIRDTAVLYTAQFGGTLPVGGGRLTLGGSYYDVGAKNKGAAATSGELFFFGNSLNDDGTFANDYKDLEFFGEYNVQVGTVPLQVFADVVRNLDAETQNLGWAAGVDVGDAGRRGGWLGRYRYQDLEADAVWGFFTDSDFGGGGTDVRGHVFSFGYGVTDDFRIGVTWYQNEYGMFTFGEPIDFERIFIDLNFSL